MPEEGMGAVGAEDVSIVFAAHDGAVIRAIGNLERLETQIVKLAKMPDLTVRAHVILAESEAKASGAALRESLRKQFSKPITQRVRADIDSGSLAMMSMDIQAHLWSKRFTIRVTPIMEGGAGGAGGAMGAIRPGPGFTSPGGSAAPYQGPSARGFGISGPVSMAGGGSAGGFSGVGGMGAASGFNAFSSRASQVTAQRVAANAAWQAQQSAVLSGPAWNAASGGVGPRFPGWASAAAARPLPAPVASRLMAPLAGLAAVDAAAASSLRAPVQRGLGSFYRDLSNGIEKRIAGLQSEARRFQFAGSTLTRSFTAPALIIGGAMAYDASRFQKRMAQIPALTSTPRDLVPALSGRVLGISRDLGQDQNDLAGGLYEVASSGHRGGAGIKTLEAAARGAAIGMGETKVVAGTLTSILAAYGMTADHAAKMTDKLAAMINFGRGEAEQYAPALGKVISMAGIAGVSFEEVGAS
ncbi:MAG TPA: phage tail tape measure protein, partial [Chloroflexota bacterium]|nr:phage tail tape measure protein [Chloroflexota bacterium]